MSERLVLAGTVLLALASPALAEPPTSPFVVAYEPPPVVDSSHRGMTLELSLGAGTSTQQESTAGGTFAAGAWLHHDAALAFRVAFVGRFSFVGGSLQYFVSDSFWVGGGLGSIAEKHMDPSGGFERTSAFGGFGRVGYNLTGHHHALYISGEVQGASIDGEVRDAALLAIGYQLL